MKKLIAMILTLAMVMSLCVAPASAAGSGVAITITPDKESVDTATGDAVVTYTVKAKVTDTTLKVGALTITLDPSAGLTLAEKMEKDDSAFFYQTTSKQYKYDEEAGTGIFDVKFSYAPKTKTFVAAGATNDRNLNSTHGEVVLMTIMGKIAQGTTGSVTLGTTTCTYGDVMAEASHNCDVTPATVTITKAPIASVTASVAEPAAGQPLDFNGTVDSSAPYSITKVEWFESTNASGTPVTAPATAKAKQFYYARITLTAKSGETFAASLDNTISGIYSVARNSETELYLTKVYQTGSLPAASVTAKPTAYTGLEYNGSEQFLLNFVGTASGGDMQYSLDNSSWSTAIPKGKNAGEYTVYYKVEGDGSHSDSAVASISATIGPKDISTATIGSIADQSYTGSAITPALEVKDGTATLTQDTDYTVSCTDTYVGTATLTITGKGNYTGEKKGVNFNIVAADQNPNFTTPVDLVSGGHRLDLTTLVSGAKSDVMTFTITSGTAANLSGHELESTGTTGPVTIKVSIEAKDMNSDGKNEYNAFSKSDAITVNVVNKTPASLTVTQDDTTYGSALANPDYDTTNMIASSLRVTYKGRGTTSYTENTTMPNDAGTYTVKVTYETATEILSGSADFTIEPKSISGATVTPSNTSLEYNGSAQTVTVTVKDGAYPLTKDTAYTVTSGNSGTDVGSYTVTVTGQGNYKDTAKATWKITKRDLTVTPEPNQSKKFGAEDPTLTFMPTGAVSGQTPSFTGALSRAEGVNVGQYDITLGTLAMTDDNSSGFKASNYTLKLNSTPVKFEIKKADAPTLPDISVSQKYNVTAEQSKDIGTAGMPGDAGALTYRADSSSVITTGTATVSNFTVDSTTGMVKYTITGGAAGAVINLPVVIESTNYADATAHVVITLTRPSYSGGTSYAITVEKAENGTVSADRGSASKGSTVTITVKPDKGYELDALKVLDKNGDKVKLTEKNGKYTFTMPAGKVTVKGSFVEEVLFDDVKVGDYFYEAVKWAVKKDITNGVGNDLFAPNQPCTRGQIVTFLWRAAGSPEAKAMSAFSDVADSAYYAKAVAWAVENGITGGTGNGKFSPDATCTRAQAVTFLYRAAGSPKVSGSAEFGDVATNAYYADAVAWAAKNGITGGIGGGLFGSGNDCTRAQIVTFLYRSVK